MELVEVRAQADSDTMIIFLKKGRLQFFGPVELESLPNFITECSIWKVKRIGQWMKFFLSPKF